MNYSDILHHAWQNHLAAKSPSAPTVISTFAGCGGSSLGYSMAGFRELLAVEWDEHAVRTFKANFPHVPMYHGDIAKLSVEQCLNTARINIGELDVFDGSPPCFPKGTMILTSDGAKPIEALTVDTSVLTHSGKYEKVESLHKREYHGELIMIEPRYGRNYITSTPEHPFFVKKSVRHKTESGSTKSFLEPQWRPAHELNDGDLLLEPHVQQELELQASPVINKQLRNRKSVNGTRACAYVLSERACDLNWKQPAMAWVLGLYLAEGRLRGKMPSLENSGPYRREVIFSMRDSKAEYAATRLKQAGLHPSMQPHGDRVVRLTITDSDFWVLCRTMGQYAHGKSLPSAFFAQTAAWQRELLAGYFYGDGYTRQCAASEVLGATTVSLPLAQGIAKIVARVYGVVASVEMNEVPATYVICGREVNQRTSYTVRFRPTPTERDRLGHVDAYGAWIPIRRVHRTVPVKCQVYNLEVSSDHSYVANGFAVHNCQGFSTSGKRQFSDNRNQLFKEYVRLLQGLKPKVFVMENVSGMVKGKMKLIFAEILRELKACGYQVSARLLNASHYGVPQARERMIFIGVRNDFGIAPTHPLGRFAPITVKEALHDCTPSEIVPLTGKNLAKMQLLRPGANAKEKERASLAVFGKVSGFTLLRIKWHAPAPTILKTVSVSPTFGAGLIMPNEDRYVSIAELKRLGSFPDEFQLEGTFEERWARIGNSVPPLLMRAIAEHIKDEILARVNAPSKI